MFFISESVRVRCFDSTTCPRGLCHKLVPCRRKVNNEVYISAHVNLAKHTLLFIDENSSN